MMNERPVTVLIADDDVRNIFSLTKALEQQGVEIISAMDGRDAIKQLEAAGRVDLVLMDMMMHEMDGYEAIREVSRRYEERVAENAKNAPRKSSLIDYAGGIGVRACNALLTRRLKADVERHSLLAAGNSVVSEEKKGKTVKAALYGVQVFYSFFIM